MIRDLYHFFKSEWNKFRFLSKLKRLHPTCSFEEGLKVKGPIGNLQLGKNIQIQSNALFHLGGMNWCKNEGSLIIGDYACISPNVIIYAAGPGGVKVGHSFDCGPGVKIFASHSDVDKIGEHVFGKVIIGDEVILFANVVISPGVHIGDRATVLAGAVVNKDVPSDTIFGGVPARLIRSK